jgi:hypothetical protein
VTEISLFTEERGKNKGNQDHKVKRRFEEMKERQTVPTKKDEKIDSNMEPSILNTFSTSYYY